ncbi:MAG: hypothetical protein HQL98_03510 [Magnetococcales bacterium]|nr:hypothetical protein [Magnetococcales bacterium]
MQTTVALPDDLEESFRMMAEETGQTIHECVIKAMRRYLEEMEERHDIEDAQSALAVYGRHHGPALTLEDAMERYGLTREELIS